METLISNLSRGKKEIGLEQIVFHGCDVDFVSSQGIQSVGQLMAEAHVLAFQNRVPGPQKLYLSVCVGHIPGVVRVEGVLVCPQAKHGLTKVRCFRLSVTSLLIRQVEGCTEMARASEDSLLIVFVSVKLGSEVYADVAVATEMIPAKTLVLRQLSEFRYFVHVCGLVFKSPRLVATVGIIPRTLLGCDVWGMGRVHLPGWERVARGPCAMGCCWCAADRLQLSR